MRRTNLILISVALLAGASSCGSKESTRLRFPPVTDLAVEAEPAYPLEALQPGDAGKAAEDKWWNDVLIWGRVHNDRLARVCRWAATLGANLPKDYCDPS